MKRNLFIISSLFLFCSCTTNISLDQIYKPKIVVQGQILENGTTKIKLSQTVNTTEEDVFPVVKNAVIKVTSSDGESEQLTEFEGGIYEGDSLLGIAGKSYLLEVNMEGTTNTAETVLPTFDLEILELTLDSLPKDSLGFCPQLLSIEFNKVNVDDVYLIFSISLNGFLHPAVVFYKNEQMSPQNLNVPLDTIALIASGDVIGVDLLLVEKWHYDYLKKVENSGNQEIISGLLIGPPDNLKGNLEGGALGYFGAAAKRFLEITAP